jgi:hypothetical protein
MTTDLRIVCHESTRLRRHVELALYREAYAKYGYTYPQPPGAFELDHLVPLELGGSNGIENLWPQPADTMPAGFREKDQLEHYLHEQVCSARVPLEQAQRAISTDWISAWHGMRMTQ